MVTVSNAFGLVRSITYDVRDRATNIVDANGVTITNTYDNLDRLVTRGYPDGGVERFGYTTNVPGMTSYTNQLDQTNFYAYDPFGRKTVETNANWEITQFKYDSSGNLTNLVDGKNQNTFWKYDVYGRMTNKVDNFGTNLFAYGYDSNDRLTSRASAAKGTTYYSYDSVGNLKNVNYPVSHSIAFYYDALNRLSSMSDGIGATAYTYDAASHLLSEDGPWASDKVSYTFTNGLRTSLSVQDPAAAAWTQSYDYDAGRRLWHIISPQGTYEYIYFTQPSSLVNWLTLPNGAYITNTYDSMARLLSTGLFDSQATPLNSHSYGYTVNNQRTGMTNTFGDYRGYTYDNIGQLKAALGKEAGGVTNRLHEQFGYAYDAARNLNYRTNNQLVQPFTVNSLNELSTITRNGTLTVAGTTTIPATNVTVSGTGLSGASATLYADNTWAQPGATLSSGTNTYTATAKDSLGRQNASSVTVNLPATRNYAYDLNGNLLSDGTRCFAYDDENQMTSVWVTNAWRSDFVYDGMMRRRIRTDYSWNGNAWVTSATLRYVYDGNLVIQERNGNNLPLVTYTRGNDLSGSLQGAGGIGGLLARTDNALLSAPPPYASAHAYYHADGNGNVTALIDGNQHVVARYEYDPFGNILSQSGFLADANVYRFSSKEYHQNSGLIYYLYRLYDPNLQRWPNRDPLGDDGSTVYAIAGFEPSLESPSVGELAAMVEAVQNPLDIFTRVNLNLFGAFANNPISIVDFLGLDCYAQNRQLAPKLLNHDPWPRSRYNPLSHTFRFTTNPDGTLNHTYSWGTDANPHGWVQDYGPDKAAANQALKEGGNYLHKIGDSSLDEFMEDAFNDLQQNEPEHKNGILSNNCKTEASKLDKRAKQLQQQQ